MVPKILIDVLESQLIEVSKKPNYIIKRKEEVPRVEARMGIVLPGATL